MNSLCVLGLGYIGLPTASMFATNGLSVVGVDTNTSVVDTINRGEVHIEEPGLNVLVQAATRSGRLVAATEPKPADVFIIAVPTPCVHGEGGDPGADLSAVRAAATALCPVLEAGNVVILESTSPPGTTRRVVAQIIETETGLVAGRDIAVAHCPERVLPGQILKELIENDRVIGGVTPSCAERAAALYRPVIEGRALLTDAETAEMTKLMENTFRDVNIALANELALIAERHGLDADAIIALANRHPRVHLHKPGVGVGGHCISVDPWFVIEAAPGEAKLMRLAREINDARPGILADELARRTGGLEGRKVAVMGVAYKGNVDDVRESPATTLIDALRESGADVAIYDPHVKRYQYEVLGLAQALDGADVVVVACAHDEFAYLDPQVVAAKVGGRRVYDMVGALDEDRWTAAGFTFWRTGRRDEPGNG